MKVARNSLGHPLVVSVPIRKVGAEECWDSQLS